ncbi:MAG: Crp/Fnr family transcriptional regulator [Dehalococcoidia bacterium]|nr:Crp/Fnr family transcriptional regulator [Dehalococcoidia bacterium]MCA9824458.1 Crp/Fnr family transcriptional regulator [Dehalococcoidia bacterium]
MTEVARQALNRSIGWYLRQLSRVMRVLNDDELDRIVPLLSERRFTSKQHLFVTGDAVERVYLLLQGRVKVYQVADNGKEVILDIVSRGDVVGDMAIVEAGERIASAQALEDTLALSISWEDFSHLLQQSPRLGFVMVELMAKRLSGMQRTFANLVAKPVSARLADTLIARAEGNRVRLGLTHQELSQTIGTSRETVTALLSRFVVLGAITQADGGFLITDPDLLDDIASGHLQVSARHPAGREPSIATS